MQFSKLFRIESLTFVAFLVTLPIYAPTQLLFDVGAFSTTEFMAPLANTMLGSTVVFGLGFAITSNRIVSHKAYRATCMVSGVTAYVAGYVILASACLTPEIATSIVGAVSGFLLAWGTVVIAILWGTYFAQFELRQALPWCAVSMALSACMQLLLSTATFTVCLIVFCIMLILSFPLPCWYIWKMPITDYVVTESESPRKTLSEKVQSMASVASLPFSGLMIFAFMMGARQFIIFDDVHMEILGCALGALLVLPIFLMRSTRPLLSLIYQILVPAFALLLILLHSFPVSTTPMFFAAWLSYVFYGALATLALAVLTGVAHAGEFSTQFVFGLACASFALFSLLGIACSQTPLFAFEGGGPALLVVSTVYFVAVIAASILTLWNEAKSPTEPAEEAETNDVASRCAALAQEGNLTLRESEILGYLGRGHGIAFIANTLVISESTVRSHVKSIYKKLDVNSREHLLERVNY